MGETTSNLWRWLVTGLLFIVWIGLSFYIYDYVTLEISTEWYAYTIAITVAWLAYVPFAYALLTENWFW